MGPDSRVRGQQHGGSVGFSAYSGHGRTAFGVHPGLRWISPAYRPAAFRLKGNICTASYICFNIPAFLVVMILTVILVRGIRESAEANNTMVIIKIAAILAFIVAASHYINPANWHPFAPMGWSGILTGGSIIFFTYIGFDSVSTAAEEREESAAGSADRNHHVPCGLHTALHRRSCRADRRREMAISARRRGSSGEQPERSRSRVRVQIRCDG